MDYEHYGGLSYDEQVLGDKLGLLYEGYQNASRVSQAKQSEMEDRIRAKLEEEYEVKLRKEQEKLEIQQNPVTYYKLANEKQHSRSGFTSGCANSCECGGFTSGRTNSSSCRCNGSGGCQCSGGTGRCSGGNSCNCNNSDSIWDLPPGSIFNNKKILIMLIFVLSVFCIIQYLNQQQLASEMKDLIQIFNSVKSNNSTGAAQTSTNIPQAVPVASIPTSIVTNVTQ